MFWYLDNLEVTKRAGIASPHKLLQKRGKRHASPMSGILNYDMDPSIEKDETNPSQSQKTVAAHVDSRLFRGMANEGDMRAHEPEAFKKFKAAAKRVIVTREVLSLLQGASETLRDAQAEYQRGKLLPSQSQKQVASDTQQQQQEFDAAAEQSNIADGPLAATRSSLSRPGSAVQRPKSGKMERQKNSREDWGYFSLLGVLRAAPSAVAAARSNPGLAPEQPALSWDAATRAEHDAWEYSDDSDEDNHRNDPTWRDVLYDKRAKRQQSRGFVEWSVRNRAASMIQATWRLYRHRLEKLAMQTVEEAMRRRPKTPAEYHEIHQRLWQQQRSFRRRKSSGGSDAISRASTGRSLSPTVTEADEENDSDATAEQRQQQLGSGSLESSLAPSSLDVAEAPQHRVKFSEGGPPQPAAPNSPTPTLQSPRAGAAAAAAQAAKQASGDSSSSTSTRKARKPVLPIVEVPKKPKVRVQPFAAMVGREAVVSSTTKWKAASKAIAAADALARAVYVEGSVDSLHSPGLVSPHSPGLASPHSSDLVSPHTSKSPKRDHGETPGEPVNSAAPAADRIESSSAASSSTRSPSVSPEPAAVQEAASTKQRVSWGDVPVYAGAPSVNSAGPQTASRKASEYSSAQQLQVGQAGITDPAAATGASSGSDTEHVEVSLSGAAAPAAVHEVAHEQQQQQQLQQQQPWHAAQHFLDGSHIISLLQHKHQQGQQPNQQQTGLLKQEQQERQHRQHIGSSSGFLPIDTDSGAVGDGNRGSRASSLAGALVDFSVGIVSSMISLIRTGSITGGKSASSSSEGKSSSNGARGGSKEGGKGSGSSDVTIGHSLGKIQQQPATVPTPSSPLFAAINRELSTALDASSDLPGRVSVLPRTPVPPVLARVSLPHVARMHSPVPRSPGSPGGASSSAGSSGEAKGFMPSSPQHASKAVTGRTAVSEPLARLEGQKANADAAAPIGKLTVSTAACAGEIGQEQSAPRSPRAARAMLRRSPDARGPAAGPVVARTKLPTGNASAAMAAGQNGVLGPDVASSSTGDSGNAIRIGEAAAAPRSHQQLSSLSQRFAAARRMSQTTEEQVAHQPGGSINSTHSASVPASPPAAQADATGAVAAGATLAPRPNKQQSREQLLGTSAAGPSTTGVSSAVSHPATKPSGSPSLSPSSSGSLFTLPAGSSTIPAGYWATSRRLSPNMQTQQQLQQQQKAVLRVGSASPHAPLQAAGRASSSTMGADVRSLGVSSGIILGVRPGTALGGTGKTTDISYRRSRSTDLSPSQISLLDYGAYPASQQRRPGTAAQLPIDSFGLLSSQQGSVQGQANAMYMPSTVLSVHGMSGHADKSTTSVAARGAAASRLPSSSYDAAAQEATSFGEGSNPAGRRTSKAQVELGTSSNFSKTSQAASLPALNARRVSSHQ